MSGNIDSSLRWYLNFFSRKQFQDKPNIFYIFVKVNLFRVSGFKTGGSQKIFHMTAMGTYFSSQSAQLFFFQKPQRDPSHFIKERIQ